jgi:hypothetical protein
MPFEIRKKYTRVKILISGYDKNFMLSDNPCWGQ